MSPMDEPATRTTVWWAVDQTIENHAQRTCPQCKPEGCPQLEWAVKTRREWIAIGEVDEQSRLLR
ncbi:hypothetical protein ACIBF5_09420 [Micromonospora sp. NPDC050417]|uniref:hypothetical protein n=1 Tax=Micromonospora sp. NPDC050417 TaxID=3364280 RepID=UPI0037BCD71D